MLFPTVDFAVFFVIVFTGSWMLRPYAKPWRWFVLVASCVFYLDPFSPVATEGQGFIHLNLPIAALLTGFAVAVSQLLRVALPADTPQAQPVGAGVGGRGTDLEGGDGEGVDLDPVVPVPPRYRVPAAAVAVPVLVAAAFLVGNIAVNRWWPDRPDQAWRFLFLVLGVALCNQAFAKATFAALGPHRERTPVSRWIVRCAVAFDLGVLAYFKYLNFFGDLPVFQQLIGAFGLHPPFDIILPVAISFFTFQAISYVVDVGRGELHPIPLLDFTVYLSFFAHVVAGPIVRVAEFAPQLDARSDPRFVQASEAFMLIFRGMFKKVVVSSLLATNIVDPVFANPDLYSQGEVLLAIYGYAIQIYADFSGYTDIAIGVALLLGVRFPQNFDAPYRSLSLQEFWRRWHMTLSRWLRDYLYIPLGGNRKGVQRTYVNLFLTMVLGGLWHGASLSFLIWGAIHGGGLAVERWAKPRWRPIGLPAPVVRTLQWILTFHVVCFAWVFFRTGSPQPGDGLLAPAGRAFDVLGSLFTGTDTPAQLKVGLTLLSVVIVLMLLSQFVPPRIPDRITTAFARTPPIVQAVALAGGLVLVNVLGPEGVAPFIYFQF